MVKYLEDNWWKASLVIVIMIKLENEWKVSKVMCLSCTKNGVLGDTEPSLPYISLISTEQEFCTCEKLKNVSDWATATTGVKTGRELLGHRVYLSTTSDNSSSKLMRPDPALSCNCICFTLTSKGVFQHLTLLVVKAANFQSDFFHNFSFVLNMHPHGSFDSNSHHANIWYTLLHYLEGSSHAKLEFSWRSWIDGSIRPIFSTSHSTLLCISLTWKVVPKFWVGM